MAAPSSTPQASGHSRPDLLPAYEGYRDALLLSRTPEGAQGTELDTRNRILGRYRCAAVPTAPAAEKAYYVAFKEIATVIKERNEALKALAPLKAEVQSLTTQVAELQSHNRALNTAVTQMLSRVEEAFMAIRNTLSTATAPQG